MVVTDRPQIIYALITRGPKVVLAEYSSMSGNWQQAAIQCLPKLEPTVDFKSYIYNEYGFHYIIDEGGTWFVCMAEQEMGRRLPFAFLQKVLESFKQRYTDAQVASAIAGSLQAEFRPELQTLMEKFNSPEADRVAAMSEKVKNINDNLLDSIDKILERQEKIELLVDRSQSLSDSSASFRREAEQLRRVVWWRNVRTMGILGLVAFLAIIIIVMMACGPTFASCR